MLEWSLNSKICNGSFSLLLGKKNGKSFDFHIINFSNFEISAFLQWASNFNILKVITCLGAFIKGNTVD